VCDSFVSHIEAKEESHKIIESHRTRVNFEPFALIAHFQRPPAESTLVSGGRRKDVQTCSRSGKQDGNEAIFSLAKL